MCCLFMVMHSSHTLFHSFFSLILLLVCHPRFVDSFGVCFHWLSWCQWGIGMIGKKIMFIMTHSPKMAKVWKEMKVNVRMKIQTNLTQRPSGSAWQTRGRGCKHKIYVLKKLSWGQTYTSSYTHVRRHLCESPGDNATIARIKVCPPNIKWKESKIHQGRESSTKKVC